MIMKKLATAIILLVFHLVSYAFEWKSQSNEDLRADMIMFAEQFAGTTQDRKLSADLNEFVMLQKAEANPYKWIAQTNAFVDRWLKKYPAELSDGGACSYERRSLLLLRDYPMHADNYRDDATQELKDAYESSIRKMHREAERDALKSSRLSLRIIPILYNPSWMISFAVNFSSSVLGICLR